MLVVQLDTATSPAVRVGNARIGLLTGQSIRQARLYVDAPGLAVWREEIGARPGPRTAIVLTRRRGEAVMIEGGIEVRVLRVRTMPDRAKVKVGIRAPEGVPILREGMDARSPT